MNFAFSVKQWLFERSLGILAILALCAVYQTGSVWYGNLRFIGSAYGISI